MFPESGTEFDLHCGRSRIGLIFTGSCQELHIEGKGNQVTIDTVGLVVIDGTDNIVHVNNTIPRTTIHGKGNKLTHPVPSPPAPPPAPVPPPA